jgi:hypothetical protein
MAETQSAASPSPRHPYHRDRTSGERQRFASVRPRSPFRAVLPLRHRLDRCGHRWGPGLEEASWRPTNHSVRRHGYSTRSPQLRDGPRLLGDRTRDGGSPAAKQCILKVVACHACSPASTPCSRLGRRCPRSPSRPSPLVFWRTTPVRRNRTRSLVGKIRPSKTAELLALDGIGLVAKRDRGGELHFQSAASGTWVPGRRWRGTSPTGLATGTRGAFGCRSGRCRLDSRAGRPIGSDRARRPRLRCRLASGRAPGTSRPYRHRLINTCTSSSSLHAGPFLGGPLLTAPRRNSTEMNDRHGSFARTHMSAS